MTREEFRDLLRKHDWHFPMTDDPHVYRSGCAAQVRIDAHSHDCPEFEADRQEAAEWIFSGRVWGTPEQPKPDWWDGGVK